MTELRPQRSASRAHWSPLRLPRTVWNPLNYSSSARGRETDSGLPRQQSAKPIVLTDISSAPSHCIWTDPNTGSRLLKPMLDIALDRQFLRKRRPDRRRRTQERVDSTSPISSLPHGEALPTPRPGPPTPAPREQCPSPTASKRDASISWPRVSLNRFVRMGSVSLQGSATARVNSALPAKGGPRALNCTSRSP